MNGTRPSIRRTLAAAGAVGLCCSFSAPAGAEDGAQLIENARCYACHQMTETLLAPPYLAIAVRHAPRKDLMTEVLARKIVRGGGGNWGVVPMVPNQWVSIEEARVMAEWILALADEG
jgi:cytochrome c